MQRLQQNLLNASVLGVILRMSPTSGMRALMIPWLSTRVHPCHPPSIPSFPFAPHLSPPGGQAERVGAPWVLCRHEGSTMMMTSSGTWWKCSLHSLMTTSSKLRGDTLCWT